MKDQNCIEVNYTPLIDSVNSEHVLNTSESTGGGAKQLQTIEFKPYSDRTIVDSSVGGLATLAAQNAIDKAKLETLVSDTDSLDES